MLGVTHAFGDWYMLVVLRLSIFRTITSNYYLRLIYALFLIIFAIQKAIENIIRVEFSPSTVFWTDIFVISVNIYCVVIFGLWGNLYIILEDSISLGLVANLRIIDIK